ncbi:DDE-type integrase/transposase/recombinase [Gaetbulibacter sp. M235]|uniref:DDE-type integrase/transposase/recombinase n=1 Tax=Gaetbulibacter sp. M235 TaxID=3126510 RepID=UPI00374F150B
MEVLYRAEDKEGNTIDFLFTKRGQRMSSQSFLNKAINNNGHIELINIDKSGSNKGRLRFMEDVLLLRYGYGSASI